MSLYSISHKDISTEKATGPSDSTKHEKRVSENGGGGCFISLYWVLHKKDSNKLGSILGLSMNGDYQNARF